MTEAEFLASEDPARMLTEPMFGYGTTVTQRVSDRKLRLFACACWRANPRREEFYSREGYESAEAADGVRELRRRHKAGATIKTLAAHYGISEHQARCIVGGRSWKHVGEGGE